MAEKQVQSKLVRSASQSSNKTSLKSTNQRAVASRSSNQMSPRSTFVSLATSRAAVSNLASTRPTSAFEMSPVSESASAHTLLKSKSKSRVNASRF